VKQLKALSTENAKLKTLLAERDLEIEVMKRGQPKKMVSPRGRREQVSPTPVREASRNSVLAGCWGSSRSTLAYELRQPAKDEPVMAAMKRLSAQYPRYGYRRIRIFLRREGMVMGIGARERLWRKAGCSCPASARVAARSELAQRPLPPRAANHVWAYDFVFDACANGQQLKCLTVSTNSRMRALPSTWPAASARARHRRAHATDERPRRASLSAVGQRSRVRKPCRPQMGYRRAHRNRAHRPRKAVAERHQRIVQRQIP
jgi:hypothetical protein